MKARALIALCAAVLVSGCAAAPRELSDADAAAVRAQFDSTVAQLLANNISGWSTQFSADARFYAPNAPPLTGRPAIQAWGEAMPRIEQFSFSNVQVAGNGELAWGTSGYVIKFQGMPVDTGNQVVVFGKNAAGAWEVLAGAFNSQLPLPMAPPPPARR